MEFKEAKEIFERFYEALRVIKIEANQKEVLANSNSIYRVNEGKLKDEIKQLKDYKRKFELLQKASNVEICKDCNGEGGGIVGDEYSGFDGWNCDTCQGTGIIEKVMS